MQLRGARADAVAEPLGIARHARRSNATLSDVATRRAARETEARSNIAGTHDCALVS